METSCGLLVDHGSSLPLVLLGLSVKCKPAIQFSFLMRRLSKLLRKKLQLSLGTCYLSTLQEQYTKGKVNEGGHADYELSFGMTRDKM